MERTRRLESLTDRCHRVRSMAFVKMRGNDPTTLEKILTGAKSFQPFQEIRCLSTAHR